MGKEEGKPAVRAPRRFGLPVRPDEAEMGNFALEMAVDSSTGFEWKDSFRVSQNGVCLAGALAKEGRRSALAPHSTDHRP